MKQVKLQVVGSPGFKYPREFKILKRTDEVTKLFRWLTDNPKDTSVMGRELYEAAFPNPCVVEILDTMHWLYSVEGYESKEPDRPDILIDKWLSYTQQEWAEMCRASPYKINKSINKLLEYKVIEKRVFRNSNYISMTHIHAFRCGPVGKTPTILNDYDHLLQHLPGFEFDLTGKY